jgi:DDRGK domain
MTAEAYEENDPFDNYSDETEVGVGFSDTTLLAVSVLGFVVMAFFVYITIVSRVAASSAENAMAKKGGGDGGELLDYEEELLRSDVASLNRAQRRLRAKAVMKRERRAATTTEDTTHHHEEEEVEEDDDHQALSRKEREKAAKATEKRERHLNDETRREEQRQAVAAAKEDKKRRLELEAKRAREEKLRREEQLEQEKVKQFNQWNTFLASPDGTNSLSVQDWVQELQHNGAVAVPLKDLTIRFDCSMEHVKERICQLVDAGRINGVIDEETLYLLSHAQLLSLASFVASNGEVSLGDLAEETRRLLSPQQ